MFDEEQKVFPVYGATKTPQVYILGKDLEVKYIGAIDDNADNANAVKKRYVEDAIIAIENGQDPNPGTTKAIGCSIKSRQK